MSIVSDLRVTIYHNSFKYRVAAAGAPLASEFHDVVDFVSLPGSSTLARGHRLEFAQCRRRAGGVECDGVPSPRRTVRLHSDSRTQRGRYSGREFARLSSTRVRKI